MFEIGGSLAAARKGQDLTFPDAERLTCLRGKYIVALEHDDFDALPGRVYARAFLRTYAHALGLDADRFVDEFDARFPEPEEEGEPFPVFQLERRRSARPRVAAGVLFVAVIAGVVAWTTAGGRNAFTPVAAPPAARAADAPKPKSHVLGATHTKAASHRYPLVISATTGECWLLVRHGGSNGAVIFQGILEPGKTLTFAAHVWVRFGAPWNVRVHRGAEVPAGLKSTSPVNLSL